jgi:Mrp family chromosome partitioning ATPase
MQTAPSTPVGPQEPRSLARAERFSRWRATALSTVIQAQLPKGLPEEEPVVIASDKSLAEEALADMALRPEEIAPNKPQPEKAAERTPPPPLALPSFSLAGVPKPEQVEKPGAYPISDLYRELRQNVLAVLPPTLAASLAWISPTGSEEAATHLVELALSLAETASGEILLVDANFHSAALSRRLGLADKPGLAEVLAKKIHVQAAGVETAMARVRVLPRGSEISGSLRRSDPAEWRSLLASLKSRYQYVVVDAPGVEQPHCLPLAKAADATYLVIGLDYTPRETVHEAIETLDLNGVRVAGCVITDAPE